MSTEAINRSRNTAAAGDRDERARLAVKVFRTMQHGLTAYARAITGDKKVRVEISSGPPMTDGKIIKYRPPIALGDRTPHDRHLCDRRAPDTGLLICPACKVREEVLVNIYHEIAHIAFGTFAKTTDRAQRDALDLAVKEWGGKYEKQLRARFASAPDRIKNSYLGLANIISPFLPYLVNCLEDARVDGSMFRARKGTRKMLEADTFSLIRDGIPNADGELESWSTAPLNSQVALACYLEGAGYVGWEPHLHPKITETFADDQVRGLVRQIPKCRTAADTYNLAFPILARLRELGYFQMPEDEQEQQPDESQEEQPQESDDSADDTSDGEGTSDQPNSDDSGGDQGVGESDESDESASDDGGGAGGPSEEEETDDTGPDQDSSGSEGADDPADPQAGEGDAPGEGGEDTPTKGEGDADGGDDESGVSGGDEASEDTDGADEGAGGSDDLPESSEGGDGTEEGVGDDSDSDSVPPASEEDGEDDAEGSGSGDDADGADEGASPEQGSDSGDGDPGEPDEGSGAENPIDGRTEEAGGRGDDSSLESGDDDRADEASADLESGGEGDVPGSELDNDLDGQEQESEADEAQDSGDSGFGGASDPAGPDSEDSSGMGEQSRDETLGPDERQPDSSDDSGREDEPDGEPEVINSGADQGLGGLEVDTQGADDPGYGSVEECAADLESVHAHIGETEDHPDEDAADQKAIAIAVVQGLYFETPSTVVNEINEHYKLGEGKGWNSQNMSEHRRVERGIECDLDIPESVMGPALLVTRRIFTDNQTAKLQPNLRSGRVNKRVLGRRAWNDDDRLFAKKRVPGKKNYAVLIGIDISGSTIGNNIVLAKRAAFAQAELCHRMGIKFAVFAHCTGRFFAEDGGLSMEIYHVKDWNSPWDTEAKMKISELSGTGGNLDGHTMEFYRKQLDQVDATDKILLYYTDGKMPAANHDEELEVLQREIRTCRTKGYTLLGVGIRTDSPIRHGLDTVQVDDDDDLKRVVDHLGKRLATAAR